MKQHFRGKPSLQNNDALIDPGLEVLLCQDCNTVDDFGSDSVGVCAGAAGTGACVPFDCQPGPGAPLDQGPAQRPLQVPQWQRGETIHISLTSLSACPSAQARCLCL